MWTTEEAANFNREDARRVMGALLAQSGEEDPFDLVFAFNDEMAAGVYDAYTEADREHLPLIIGIDALLSPDGSGTIPYILNGMIDASFIYPTGGSVVIDIARRILMGVDYQRENILSTELVNSANVRVYQAQMKQMAEKQRRAEDLNSRIRGNLQASSLYTDAFQNPSVIYQSIPILSSARPWLLENESLFNPSQYDEIMRNAHLDPSAGSCRISQLGSVIKDMFKGYGRKIIVRYNQSKERFMLSLSIPSRKSASEYAIISSTGYWWFSASGRLDQIDPVSTESESAACDLLIRVISKYL